MAYKWVATQRSLGTPVIKVNGQFLYDRYWPVHLGSFTTHTHTPTHLHTYTHAHTLWHTHIHTQTHTHTVSHTVLHTHTLWRTHSVTHTHTHTMRLPTVVYGVPVTHNDQPHKHRPTCNHTHIWGIYIVYAAARQYIKSCPIIFTLSTIRQNNSYGHLYRLINRCT